MNALFDRIFQPGRDGRVAILYEHRAIKYEELRAETVRTAEALYALGVDRGDRVAILLHDSPEFIASFVAIISLGAIAVPINMALRREDQLFIVEDCGAQVALIEGKAVASLFQNADAPPDLGNLLVIREAEPVASSIADLSVELLENIPRAILDSSFPVSEDEQGDAFILYTSGSTGEPKGAVHRQSDIFYTNETYCREVLRLREGDRLFSSSRLPFAYGLGNAFTFPLLNGFTTILCREKPTPEVIAQIFREYRPSVFFGVPVVYRMLLEHHRTQFGVPDVSVPRAVATGSRGATESKRGVLHDPVATARGTDTSSGAGELDTSSLRLCISAGEALPAQLGEDWQQTFDVEVLDGIGSTEMLHMFMSNHEGALRYGSSGQLLNGYEARLIDHEGNRTPPGEVGNLWIRGDSAAVGYWQRPETTAQTFVDGWVRTGDLYRCDSEGFWWHTGRSDDCFKPTGQWVSPIEVESVLMRHEAVRAAAVVEGFDKVGLSCVCAFIVNQNESGKNVLVETDLRALCESALPRFKQPRRYLFVSELPYTATGKVQRFKLREQLRAGHA